MVKMEVRILTFVDVGIEGIVVMIIVEELVELASIPLDAAVLVVDVEVVVVVGASTGAGGLGSGPRDAVEVMAVVEVIAVADVLTERVLEVAVKLVSKDDAL